MHESRESDARRDRPEVIVVTGASAGIGRATVREFAKRGHSLGLLARDREALEATRDEVVQLGGEAMVLPLDVGDADAVERAAAAVESELGPIDVWVNNAMVTALAPVWDVTPAEARRITQTNYLGTVHGTMSALSRMRGRDRGVIVQVGSALSYRAIPLQSLYCGSKFAIRGFTDALRVELRIARSSVRLTMVQLPALNTPQFEWCRTVLDKQPQPVPPIYQPEVAARAIVDASDGRRRERWVGWPTFKAILGNRLAPWFADWVLARQGFDSQQADRPLPAGRRNNMFAPVPGHHRAHGLFDDRATGGPDESTVQRRLGLRRGRESSSAHARGSPAQHGS